MSFFNQLSFKEWLKYINIHLLNGSAQSVNPICANLRSSTVTLFSGINQTRTIS